MRVEEVVGLRIRQARERMNITQEQLGERVEPLLGHAWARQAVSLAEQGKRAFTAIELVAVAYVLGVPPSGLFQLPPGIDSVEMPSGKHLDRDDLSRSARTGEESPGLAAEHVQRTLSELVGEIEAVDARTAGIRRTVERLHDEVGQAVNAARPSTSS